MVQRFLFALFAMGMAAFAAACAGRGVNEEFPIQVTDSAVASGRQVYAGNCASCHGFPGDVPPLQSAPRHDELGHTWHHADRQLFEWILDRPPLATIMPAFRDVLTEQEVRDVIAFIKSEWPAEYRSSQENYTRQYEQQLKEFGP